MILSFDLMILGVVTLIYIAVITFLVIKMIAKYIEFKNKSFLYAGMSALGLLALL